MRWIVRCREEGKMRGKWITSKNRHAYGYNVAVTVGRSMSCTELYKIDDSDDLIHMYVQGGVKLLANLK